MKPEPTRQPPSDGAYEQYERLLVKLHELNCVGKLDTDEADLIREEMDLPWYSLSSVQQSRLRGLSADLYSLNDEELHATMSDGERAAFLAEAQAAYNRNDWEGLLGVLRAANQLFPPALLAYMRGRCWSAIGRVLPASLFFAKASQLDPKNLHYSLLALDSLARTERQPEAFARAATLIREPATPPQLVFGAAKILFDSATRSSPDDALRLYEQVVDVLREALKKSEQAEAHSPRSLTVAARINLAIALDRLGRGDEARQAYDDAVAHHAESDEALMARALFLLDRDAEAAKRDLTVLVQRNTALSYPYFYLAHQALLEKDYRRCLELCERGVRLTTRGDMAANFLEWTAIAQYSLDAARDLVEFYFQSAQRLDPLNERISRNVEVFKRITKTENTPQPNFDIPRPLKTTDAALALTARLQEAAA